MVVCIISVTVDIMLLVMSTEHVILVGIGPEVLHLVKKVTIIFIILNTLLTPTSNLKCTMRTYFSIKTIQV